MDKARVKNKDLLCYEMERKVKKHRVSEREKIKREKRERESEREREREK